MPDKESSTPQIVQDMNSVVSVFERQLYMLKENSRGSASSYDASKIKDHEDVVIFLHALIDNYPQSNVLAACGLTTRRLGVINLALIRELVDGVKKTNYYSLSRVSDIISALRKSDFEVLEKHGLIFSASDSIIVRSKKVVLKPNMSLISSNNSKSIVERYGAVDKLTKRGETENKEIENKSKVVVREENYLKNRVHEAILAVPLLGSLGVGIGINPYLGMGLGVVTMVSHYFLWGKWGNKLTDKVVTGEVVSTVVHQESTLDKDVRVVSDAYAQVSDKRIAFAFKKIENELVKFPVLERESKLPIEDLTAIKMVINSQLIPAARHHKDVSLLGNDQEQEQATQATLSQLSSITIAVDEIRKKVLQSSLDNISGHSLYLDALYSNRGELDLKKNEK